jgi:hypothetical protein
MQVLRGSGAEHFKAKPRPGAKHPQQTAAACYGMAATALCIACRAATRLVPPAGGSESFGSEVDASVAAFGGVRSPGKKRVTEASDQVVLCLSNAAECLLRLGLSDAAGRLSSAAIAMEPRHTKSASRLSRALQSAASPAPPATAASSGGADVPAAAATAALSGGAGVPAAAATAALSGGAGVPAAAATAALSGGAGVPAAAATAASSGAGVEGSASV